MQGLLQGRGVEDRVLVVEPVGARGDRPADVVGGHDAGGQRVRAGGGQLVAPRAVGVAPGAVRAGVHEHDVEAAPGARPRGGPAGGATAGDQQVGRAPIVGSDPSRSALPDAHVAVPRAQRLAIALGPLVPVAHHLRIAGDGHVVDGTPHLRARRCAARGSRRDAGSTRRRRPRRRRWCRSRWSPARRRTPPRCGCARTGAGARDRPGRPRGRGPGGDRRRRPPEEPGAPLPRNQLNRPMAPVSPISRGRV